MEKLFDSELKVMEPLWEEGPLSAGQLAKLLADRVGWNRNTTYTVIKKLVDKGAVTRSDPGFVCTAALSREEVRRTEAEGLVDKLFGGSPSLFLSAFVSGKKLSDEEVAHLRELVEKLK